MRQHWLTFEQWTRERLGKLSRAMLRSVAGQLHQATDTAAATRKRLSAHRRIPPVATLVGGVLQVDPLQAVVWHRAWLCYLEAKAVAVAARQAGHHAVLAEEEMP